MKYFCFLGSNDGDGKMKFQADRLSRLGKNESSIVSPDLAASYFHLFLHAKRILSGQRSDDDEKVRDAVTSWLTSQVAIFYDPGKPNLVSGYDKCLNVLGDYVEK
ncbi:hypothetical protein AVEN_153156-1 [Araneus ventricosus]|uniref:Uncharacterized protein n=1 Tax=Araneus ventricosus TaxID=182803 RepID=A0A4Y2XB19_ARAVE|nr:hypothetical protein AVEN_153156-1 [Araneus ventricosus]